MRTRFLACAGVFVILAIGLSLVTRGEDVTAARAERELKLLNARLEDLLKSHGPDHREVLLLRERIQRNRVQLQVHESDHLSQALRRLDGEDVTNQQLRESIELLAKEVRTLRDRVKQLERKTSPRFF